MINDIGHAFCILAFLLSLISTFCGFWSLKKGTVTRELGKTVGQMTVGTTISCLISFSALAYLFLSHDYSNQFVWQFSNRTMASIYKFTAIWGGMDGSMLLWALILSVAGGVMTLSFYAKVHEKRYFCTMLAFHSVFLFFISTVVFLTNPFRYLRVPFVPDDGNGLNPLLQNPYMAIHPPMLYLGFTTSAIPYSFAIGGLLAKDKIQEWIQDIRTWSLVAWMFLTVGIVLGGHWAYLELGWGGYWAWDPVENASFIPWLTCTAFVHSLMVQERKGGLKIWNLSLVIATYLLTVFGTFLTRSGIVQSIHAFASTDVGYVFLGYILLVVIAASWLIYANRKDLSSSSTRSLISRETFFLLNNLVFTVLAFTITWGVCFPIFSEALTGTKSVLGIPYFNLATRPLFFFMLALMAVAPNTIFGGENFNKLIKKQVPSICVGILVSGIFLALGSETIAVISYGIIAAATLTSMTALYAIAIRNKTLKVVRSKGRVIGGHVVHLGILMMAVAITASSIHKTESEITVTLNKPYKVNDTLTLTVKDFGGEDLENYGYVRASVALGRGDKTFSTLYPELRRYVKSGESTSEVAIHSNLLRDVYLVLAGFNQQSGEISLKLFINPLQVWLWIGTLIVVIGTFIGLITKRGSQSATE